MSLRAFGGLLLGAALIVVSASAQAQPTPGDINQLLQQQRQILLDQEQKRREQIERLRRSAPPPVDVQTQDNTLNGPAKNCVHVHKITFEGAQLLGTETQQALRRPFIGRCMSIIDIMSVVRVVTNWYIDQGFVTTRVYPPAQDLSKGVLTIKVLEGRTEKVEIYENGTLREGADTAFPYIVGERLYIRDVEQGLDQINRLPTHDATIRIENGEKDGYSKIRVDTRKRMLPYVVSTIDNYGLKTTGELQTGTTAYVDDILGLYDSWVLSYKSSDPFYEGQKLSQEITGSVSIPFGYWTFLASGSYFDYKSFLKGEARSFRSDGVSQYITAELERVLHRDRDSKTRLAAFINYKNIENFVEDIRLETGSRKLNVIGARLSHSRRILGGLFNMSVAGHRGVPMFGTLTDEDSLPGSPVAEFSKITSDFDYYHPLPVGPFNLAWKIKGSAQWSTDDLYSTEQISLGGMYTVRGFKDQSLSGDSGGYVRNELIWTLPYLLPEETKPLFGQMDLFAAYDAGRLIPDKNDPFEKGTVTGLTAGMRLSGGLLMAEVAYEKPLDAPDFIKKDEQFRFQAGLSLKW